MAASRKELIALGSVIAGGVFGYVYTKIGKDDEDDERMEMETEADNSNQDSKIKTAYGPVVVNRNEGEDDSETGDDETSQPVDGNEVKYDIETGNDKTIQPVVVDGNANYDNETKDDKTIQPVGVDGNKVKDVHETEDDKTNQMGETTESMDGTLETVIPTVVDVDWRTLIEVTIL